MKIALSYIGYPVSAGKYLKATLRSMGHIVIHIGPFSGGALPWMPGFDFSKYADRPDVVLDNASSYPIESALEKTGKVDLVLQMDANFFLVGKSPVKNVAWAIDNHVAKYDQAEFDIFFGAHSWAYGYGNKNFVWLPCAYSPTDHHIITGIAKTLDISFIGVTYEHRQKLLNALGWQGKVGIGMGVLGEDYNIGYNRARMGLCLSACGDVPMRVFENAAQGLMLFCDRQKDLEKLGMVDGLHYVGFDNNVDAVMKFQQLMLNPEKVNNIAAAGTALLREHTYYARAQKIIDTVNET